MPKKKLSIRNLALVICMAMLFAVLAFVLVACGGGGDVPNDFYLSLASKNWQTYTSQNDIPDELHFKQSRDEENIYTLTIYLNENEQFTINQLGSDDKYGYSKLFSISDELTPGANGSIKVAKQGTYTLIFDIENNLTYEYAAEISSVSITKSVTSMLVGDAYKFEATVFYTNDATDSDVTWSSDNESVAEVNANGMVKALAEGNAKITATAGDFSDSVEINVSPNPVPATGVSLDRTQLSLEMGESETLVATVEPQNAINKDVFWDTDNAEVVTVTQEGVVTAVGYGSTTVKVSTVSGGFTAECRITVAKHATAVKLDSSNVTVAVNGAIKTVTVSFSPSDTTDTDFTFEVEQSGDFVDITKDENMLKISGKSEGTATVVVKSAYNPELTASCTINVVAADAPIASMEENLQLMIDESVILAPTLENATIKSVTWQVAELAVATVTPGSENSASVKALQFGSTTITATVTDTNSKTYTLTSKLLVADSYFFIYGYGLGAYDWDYVDYIQDRNAAEKAELLFDEYEPGIYKLTRHFTTDNGFQIVFPKVATWSETNPSTGKEVWNKNIPSDVVANTVYYDSSRSTPGAMKTTASSQFGVNANGVYTFTLDLTGESAKVYVERVSVDVTKVNLTQKSGPVMLRPGESIVLGFSCLPTNATMTDADWAITLDSPYAAFKQYIDMAIDYEKGEITITAKGDLPELFMLTVNVVCKGIEESTEFAVCPKDYVDNPVTEIKFEQDHYSFNVNNGGKAWEIPVKANVNPEATVQAVKYSVLESGGWSIDASSGLFKSSYLGTFTILATSVADESIQTTCTVTFYSDTFYLVGEFNGLSSFDAAKPNVTVLTGVFAEYKFEQITETYYRLEHEFTQVQEMEGHGRDNLEYGFQVVFLGMDANWKSRFSLNKADCYNADADLNTWNAPNVRVNTTATYILEIDLSGAKPTWCINQKETTLQEVKLEASESVLHKGDTAKIALSTAPKFATIPAGNDFAWYIDGNDDNYISGSFDSETMTYSVAVNQVPHSGDATITIRVALGELSASVTLTIVSEHHLVQMHTDQEHWWECTDAGCTYTEGRATHTFETNLTSTDPAGHYNKCQDCDYYSELVPHELSLNSSSRFDFSDAVATCKTCGFKFFEVEDGKLIHFYATATRITMPDSITEIGDSAFEGHSEITSLSFSSTLKSIGKNAFKGCSGLVIIQIPDSVTFIGHSAFSGVKARIAFSTNPAIRDFDGFDGYLGNQLTIPNSVYSIAKEAFRGSKIEKVIIPDSVYEIGDYLFYDCPELQSVIISSRVVGGFNLFKNCPKLEYVLHKGKSVWQIFENGFLGCPNFKALYIQKPYNEVVGSTEWIFPETQAAYGHPLYGKVYVYADSDPGTINWGRWADYMGGTWHWDESGEQGIENVKVWDSEEVTKTGIENVTLFFEDRTKYEA